jgi:hypothetical protein
VTLRRRIKKNPSSDLDNVVSLSSYNPPWPVTEIDLLQFLLLLYVISVPNQTTRIEDTCLHLLYHQYLLQGTQNVNSCWLELMLWPTVSRPIRLGVGHPFGTHDQIFLFPLFWRTVALLFDLGRPLWQEDGSVVCSSICQWWESRRTHNQILLSHLRLLSSLFVASYNSQGLRWKYSTLSDERAGL